MAEKKRYNRYADYDNLSEEQKKELKKALFLTKGAANNNVGCILAYLGMDAETIAKFGALWKDAEDVRQGKILCKREFQPTKQMIRARRLIEQQYKRIPQLFDTIKGRYLVAKYGEDIKQDFCNANGECALSVVDKQVDPLRELAKHCSLEHMAGGSYELDVLKRLLNDKRCVAFDGNKQQRLTFLTKVSPVENAKATAKGFDLGRIYTASICYAVSSTSSTGLEKYPELEKDFWGLFKHDLYSLANAPIEQFKKLLEISEEDADLKKVLGSEVSMIGRISEFITGRSYFSPDVYSTHQNATFNSLFIRALYTAMDEMGVGIAASPYTRRYNRGRLSTRVNKIARKVISLNEKYQKMLKNKSNSIEPAVLRDTLVGMYNEWANRSGIEYRMFVREDRPAPTLAELKPVKKVKTAKKTPSRAPKKASTAPKATVEVEGVGTFVEY